MHPARSVIYFTTASGAGYGMMIWLAYLAALGLLPGERVFALVAFGLGLGLIVTGLLSSTLHLGRPERAWRALSQWRSSWLSREGVAALTAFVPLGLFALTWSFGLGPRALSVALGVIGAVFALATIATTSMIYASLRTIPAWHNRWTLAAYLVLGPMNGAVILAFITRASGHSAAGSQMQTVALLALAAGLVVKLLYWRSIDAAAPVSTAGTATGLGHLGKVELTASPHDSDNYLLREMGFRIARKHAAKLRRIAIALGFVLPLAAMGGALALRGEGAGLMLLLLAWVSCQLGLAAERWVFFAEAKHAVTLYYGEQAV